MDSAGCGPLELVTNLKIKKGIGSSMELKKRLPPDGTSDTSTVRDVEFKGTADCGSTPRTASANAKP
ncbi:hypothetical protein HAX54_000229 [Datura stramonium]|uniref:Uncharacterized protein n=1 Tax=Datura stramonium TaxID=4076 RepID=A0ABS8T1T6_DATST|nr:hypothetical protein [Datura stramonium]